MEHDTIKISQATAVATPEPTVVMPPAGGAVAIAQETAAERKPSDAVAARPGPAQAPELELLGNQIAELSARIDAATYDLLCHLHEFDRRYGWEGWRSCAQPVPPASRSTSSAGTGQNGPLPSGLFGA